MHTIITSPVATLVITLIRAYRYLISPFFPPSCRFVPSCSEYALEAVHIHGVLKGGCLAGSRICRCHPFAAAGYDPVPEDSTDRQIKNNSRQHTNKNAITQEQ